MRHRPIAYTIEDPSGGPLRHVAGVNDIVPSFRPGHFLSAGRDSKILEWKLPDSNTISTTTTSSVASTSVMDRACSSFSMHGDQVNRLITLPNIGFVSAGAENVINLCPVEEVAGSNGASYEICANRRQEFSHHSATIKDISLLNDGDDDLFSTPDRLVACCADNTVSVFALQEPGKFLHSSIKSMPVCSVTTGPNSFYVGCLNGTVQSVDIRSKLSASEFIEDAHSNIIRDMLYIKQRMLLVTAGSDSLIRVWDCRNVMDPVLTLDTHGDAVWRLQRLSPERGDLPGFCCSSSSSGSSSSLDTSQCFVSAGREGTLQAHDVLELKTTMLAQCSYPILSMHMMEGGRAVVGTPSSEILAFSFDKIHQSGGSSNNNNGGGIYMNAEATPAGKGPRVSDDNSPSFLTPSGIKIDFDGGGAAAAASSSATKLPHSTTGDSPQAAEGGPSAAAAAAALSFQIGVAAPLVDLQEEEQPVYRSPFKPARTDSRDHLHWASFNEVSIPRPPTLPTPSASFSGGIGFIKTAQFPTRIHAAVARSDGTIAVWDVVNCRKVADLRPGVQFAHVVALLESLPALCGSWCTMSCSWGCVSVSFTDTDGSSSNLSEWELRHVAGSIYTNIIMDALSQLPTTASSSSSPTGVSAKKDRDAVTATVAATAKEQVLRALLSKSNSNTSSNWSLAMEPLHELRVMRTVRNINLWAIKRVVAAAREGRITKFLVRNLQCHHQEGDRRALYELPLTELSTLPISEEEVQAATSYSQKEKERDKEEKNEQQQQQQQHSGDDDAGSMPPPPPESPPSSCDSPGVTSILMHHRRAPRWLIVHAGKSDLLKASATVPNAFFTCDPFSGKSDPPPFGKQIPAAFSDKKPPLQLPRTSLLSELCHYIVKAIKKTPPTWNQVQETRAQLGMPLLHKGSAVLPADNNNNNNNNEKPKTSSLGVPGSRPAEPEEWIVLFSSSLGILDPSMTVGLAYSLLRQKDERNLTIKYAAITMGS